MSAAAKPPAPAAPELMLLVLSAGTPRSVSTRATHRAVATHALAHTRGACTHTLYHAARTRGPCQARRVRATQATHARAEHAPRTTHHAHSRTTHAPGMPGEALAVALDGLKTSSKAIVTDRHSNLGPADLHLG